MDESDKEVYSRTQMYERMFSADESLKPLFSKIPLFAGENQDRVMAHLMECPIVTFTPGEYILRNGDFDENCCVLLVGGAKVILAGERDGEFEEKHILEGEFFGEMAALSGLPRTADIVAEDNCAMMLIPKEKMFELLDEFALVRTRMESTYRQRILNNQLRKIHVFAGLSDSDLDALRDKASIHVYKKGEVIFREGDVADAFYLILYGFVKVSATSGRGVRNLAYLKGEQHFGEVALLEDKGRRTATVTAISRTQLVRISRTDFLDFLSVRPDLKKAFAMAARRREEVTRRMEADIHLAGTLEATIESGIIHSRSTHLLDTTKCVQCGICMQSCAQLHGGVSRLSLKGVRLNGFLLAVTSCRHCQDPACMYKCPTGAIARDPSGEIYHKKFCIGCGMCVRSCPYNSLTLVEEGQERRGGFLFGLGVGQAAQAAPGPDSAPAGMGRLRKTGKKVVKCDMCAGYDFLGCVYNCPTGAMNLIKPSEYFSELIPG